MLLKIIKLFKSLALSALMFAAAYQNVYAAQLSISNVPLFLGNSVQPNVFFVVDDSGSMDWEIFMANHWGYRAYDPDPTRSGRFRNTDGESSISISGFPMIFGSQGGGGRFVPFVNLFATQDNVYADTCGWGATAESCDAGEKAAATLDWRIRNSSVNVTFYNPTIIYRPWNGPCGNSSTAAFCTDATFTSVKSNPKMGTVGYNLIRNLAVNGDSQGGAFVYDVAIDDAGFSGDRPHRGSLFNYVAIPNGLVDLWDSHMRFVIGANLATVSLVSYDPQPQRSAGGLNETFSPAVNLAGGACYNVLGDNESVRAIKTALDAETNISRHALIMQATNGPSCRSVAQAQTNVANWFEYSRRRTFIANVALTAVMDAQPKFRYGITKFRGRGQLFMEVPAKSVTDTAPHNLTLKHRIYKQRQVGPATFLLSGMNAAGKYFDNTLSGKADPIHYACQKNFEIVFTDGYWNRRTSTKYNDADGDGVHENAADIARYYYMRDLSPLPNTVTPDTGSEADLDPDGDGNTWQHLVVFTVAFGIQGRMSDVDGDGWPDKDFAGQDWSTPGVPEASGNWGSASTCIGCNSPDKIDDLWHVAWNTNGTYANASSPEEVVQQLLNAIINIAGRVGSASAVALNSGTLNANTRIYQAKFSSLDWSGDLKSTPVKAPPEIDPVTGTFFPELSECQGKSVGEVCDTEWTASILLETRAYTSRAVYSRNTGTNAGVVFKTLTDLGASQQMDLRTHPDTGVVETVARGQDRLDWILGKDSFPAPDNFRKRPGDFGVKKLGDIIASSPAFVGAPNSLLPDSLEASRYSLFVEANKNRTKMIYVGANDGMLHAFDASNGVEKFAYVPGSLVQKLNQLTSINYKKRHVYYVDGSPQTFDIYSGGWKTVLASSAGVGDQLVFGLDITSPDTFGANQSLWEFTDANDADMGYITGNVKFARMNNGQWVVIFGNGFNNTETDAHTSTTGNGVIYVVDAYSGVLLKKFDTKTGMAKDPAGGGRPNGIAEVTVVDIDGDLDVDFLYAGDLFGNLWKIDVSSSAPASWDFAYKNGTDPKSFYSAKDATGKAQPITAGLSVKKHPENGRQTLVLFGTGQYFEVGDNQVSSSSQVQSFYSIWDDGTGDYNRSNLLEHRILQQIDLDNATDPLQEDFRITTADTDPAYKIDWRTCIDCKSHKGWYIDLLYQSSNPVFPTEYGERVVRKAVLRGNRVIFVTLIPGASACGFGGSSWIMEIDADSGSRLPNSPFDVNNNGIIDADDDNVRNIGKVVSGIRSKEGIVATPGVLNNPEGGEFKYFSGTSGSIDVVLESTNDKGLKRQSYRQLR
jgi:type IV pilus assembly protein PilY1